MDSRLMQDFVGNVNKLSRVSSAKSTRFKVIDPVNKKGVVPLGDTFLNMPYETMQYSKVRLDNATRLLYKDKVSNLNKHAVKSETESQYNKILEDYHDLYLKCMANKKIPILTPLAAKCRKKPVEKEDDFNLFVKYDPEIKSRLTVIEISLSKPKSERR